MERILGKQLDNGAWKFPGGGKKHSRATEDYDQLETFRILRQLVEKYGLNKKHPAIKKAANYLFAQQRENGVWQLSLLRGGIDQDLALWVSLAICRVFKRLFG